MALLLQVPIHQCLPWERQWVWPWLQDTFSSGEGLPAQGTRLHPPEGSWCPGNARGLPGTVPVPMTGLALQAAAGPMLGAPCTDPDGLPRRTGSRGSWGRLGRKGRWTDLYPRLRQPISQGSPRPRAETTLLPSHSHMTTSGCFCGLQGPNSLFL